VAARTRLVRVTSAMSGVRITTTVTVPAASADVPQIRIIPWCVIVPKLHSVYDEGAAIII